jgi:hypothetical protein
LPKRALGEDWDLRIHPDFLDCTVFICIEKRKNGKTVHEPIATGFILEIADSYGLWTYVVTARHCIEDPGRPELFIRANTVFSAPPQILGYADMATAQSDWFKHPTADVAVILLPEPKKGLLRYRPIRPKWFLDPDYKIRLKDPEENYGSDALEAAKNSDGFDVQCGDDIFITGLFAETAGEQRNLPVARFGNISRMPTEERLYMRSIARGRIGVIGYLAEMRSRGGLSGSPAFVHRQLFTGAQVSTPASGERRVVGSSFFVRAFMGLVSAHFDIEDELAGASIKSDAKFNSGMAIITPTKEIETLLFKDPKVMQDRKKRAANTDDRAATADIAGIRETKRTRKTRDIVIPPISRKKFFDGLTKVTQKRD